MKTECGWPKSTENWWGAFQNKDPQEPRNPIGFTYSVLALNQHTLHTKCTAKLGAKMFSFIVFPGGYMYKNQEKLQNLNLNRPVSVCKMMKMQPFHKSMKHFDKINNRKTYIHCFCSFPTAILRLAKL